MAANLREDAFSGTDHRLLKPFFDFRTNQEQATSQSYFIEAVLLSNFERPPAPGLSKNQKMVLVNSDQYPKIHLPSNLQPNLRFCDHPTTHTVQNTSIRTAKRWVMALDAIYENEVALETLLISDQMGLLFVSRTKWSN